jgi:hypothetical protein
VTPLLAAIRRHRIDGMFSTHDPGTRSHVQLTPFEQRKGAGLVDLETAKSHEFDTSSATAARRLAERLMQWNTIKIHATYSLDEALALVDKVETIF